MDKKWLKKSLKIIPELNLPVEFTGEDLRFLIKALVGDADHPNNWGTMISLAKNDGLIQPLNEWVPMKSYRSHNRKTPKYIRLVER